MDRDSSCYELVNTFLCMGERLGEKKSQAGSAFHGMDGRILPGAFFFQAKITGFHNGIPDFHRVQRLSLYN